MGSVSLDDKNPGRAQTQRYKVGGGMDGNTADTNTGKLSFLTTVNCLTNRRIGALMRRTGGYYGTAVDAAYPLGIGSLLTAQTGAILPYANKVLVNFAGTFYRSVPAWGAVSLGSDSAGMDFDDQIPSSMAQLGDRLYVAGGVPTRWSGGTNDIYLVGIRAPSTAPTFVVGAGPGFTLTSGCQYMYTLYDSVSGRESDWSPLSADVGAIANKNVTVSILNTWPGVWTHWRLYRTLDGGGTVPYFVAETALATTAYSDTTADASLGAEAAPLYDHAPPLIPADNQQIGLKYSSYINASFAECMWWVDAANPHRLVFSKPYLGDANNLEYYPYENQYFFQEPITGLHVLPNRLLVTHPKNISQITGTAASNFAITPYASGVGTLYHQSIASNGSSLVMFYEGSWVDLSRNPIYISREIDEDIRRVMVHSQSTYPYIGCVWAQHLKSFVMLVGTPYRSDMYGVTRSYNRLWTWDPSLSQSGMNEWHEHCIHGLCRDSLQNGTVTRTHLTCLHYPPTTILNSSTNNYGVVLGLYHNDNGSYHHGEAGTIFAPGVHLDWYNAPYNAGLLKNYFLTSRLTPGDPDRQRLFLRMFFDDLWSLNQGVTWQYLLDMSDPHVRDGGTGTLEYIAQLKNFDDSPHRFTTMLGGHVHLFGSTTSTTVTNLEQPLLTELSITYRHRRRTKLLKTY